jgi:hypothetical protein
MTMNCREAQEQIGAHLDGELPQKKSEDLRQHIAGCAACARELQAQQDVIRSLAGVDPAVSASAPPGLWGAVEPRLVEMEIRSAREHGRLFTFFRKPLAIAASIVLFFGVATSTVLIFTQSAEVVEAAQIDYTLLLDGLPDRVDSAIERFLSYYDARPIPAADTNAAAPALSFAVPPDLPAGFHLRQAYRVQFGKAPGVAAVYDHGDEPLVVFFHPTVDDEKSGQYREMPCVVGERHGHQVEVGDWRLMHFMDRTTCHCVLTKLDPESPELAEIVHTVAPDYAPGAGHAH